MDVELSYSLLANDNGYKCLLGCVEMREIMKWCVGQKLWEVSTSFEFLGCVDFILIYFFDGYLFSRFILKFTAVYC